MSSERADLPRALDDVLLKALAKDPDARYGTAGALADAFGAALEATRAAPVVAAPEAATVVRPRQPRRRWLAAAAGALVVVAAAGAVAAVLATRGSSHDADARRAPAQRRQSSQIEHILRASAAERRTVGNVLDAGFHCRISGSEASSRMKEAVDEPPAGARRRRPDRQPSRGGDERRRAPADSPPPLVPGRRRLPQRLRLRGPRAVPSDERRTSTAAAQRGPAGDAGEDPVRGGVQPSRRALRQEDVDGGRDLRRVAAAIAACGVRPRGGREQRRDRRPRPRIVVKPIPFGPARLAETRAYAKRHYGIDSWRLVHPHVIVEHYTASDSFASAYATFALERIEPRRAARRLRALRDRPRRNDLPARPAEHHLPAHGRPQLDRDRDRARRDERRADPGRQAAARRVARR